MITLEYHLPIDSPLVIVKNVGSTTCNVKIWKYKNKEKTKGKLVRNVLLHTKDKSTVNTKGLNDGEYIVCITEPPHRLEII